MKEDKKILLASFFFSEDDEHARDYCHVFTTLAYQPAPQRSRIKIALDQIIEPIGDCSDYPSVKQRDDFTVRPLEAFNGPRHTVLFVIDAPDECSSSDGTSSVLQLVLELESKIPCSLRVLFTSRPEKHIRRVFYKAGNHAKIVLHDIEKEIVNSDIDKYVRHELRSIFMEKILPTPDDNDIVRLVEESDRLFVHAAALRFNTDKRFLVGVPSRESVLAKRCRELIFAFLSQNMAKIEDETMQNVDVADLE